MNQDSLKTQLELARLERAIEVSESLADHRALLTYHDRISQAQWNSHGQNP